MLRIWIEPREAGRRACAAAAHDGLRINGAEVAARDGASVTDEADVRPETVGDSEPPLLDLP